MTVGAWSPGQPVRIATRGSALARAQAALVAQALAAAGLAHELVIVQTAGDQRAPDTAWGEGAFVTGIERALLVGRADLAVHSAKDIPTDQDARLRIAAYLPREDARDALVVGKALSASGKRRLDDLPAGAVIGTDSPRRTGFLRAYRLDIVVKPLHGNVDTRLRRLDEGEGDALILAVAGLTRLGRSDRISERLPLEVMPPAAGQGAIAVQIRADDAVLSATLGGLDDAATRLAVEAERAFLDATGGGCRAPIGVSASVAAAHMSIVGGFASLDGRASGLEAIEGSVADAPALAEELAARLTSRRAAVPGAPRVLVTRPAADSRRLVARLAEHAIAAVVVPAIEIRTLGTQQVRETLLANDGYDWAIVTSANGARAVRAIAAEIGTDLGALPVMSWAAVAATTARELRSGGIAAAWTPKRSSAGGIGDELPVEPGQRVLLARGSLAEDDLPATLRGRGAVVTDVVVYETQEAPRSSIEPLRRAVSDGPIAAVILASPSAVRGLRELAREGHVAESILNTPAVCIGPRTSAAAREAGFTVIGEVATPDTVALAETTAALLDDRSTLDAVAGGTQ